MPRRRASSADSSAGPAPATCSWPPHEAVETLAAHGFSADVARQYVAFARALEEGVIRPREARHAGSSNGTSFESFAAELVAAMKPA